MRLKVWLGIVSLVVGTTARAINEEGFAGTYEGEVWPYYQTGEFGSFVGRDGVRIAYAKFAATTEQGCLVILPGKSESFLKYAELVYDLRDCGYSLYLMDHRGMGLSGALVQDDHDKVHVDRFADYVADFGSFVDGVVAASPHDHWVLCGHSMGATVALLYLEEHSHAFDAAILSAPMLQIITDPLPERVALWLSSLASMLGAGTAYCAGHGPWAPSSFERNELTHSRCRWESWHEETLPTSGIMGRGGVTWRWLRESIAATRLARQAADRVGIPVLLLQAGADQLVQLGGQNQIAEDIPHCTRLLFPRSGHEILMENDETRDEAVSQIMHVLAETSLLPIRRESPPAQGGSARGPHATSPPSRSLRIG